MYQEEVKVSFGEGRYKINISSVVTAEGIAVTVTGGEKPHVGGIALSVPRKSLNAEGLSCDTWVCPVPGHKDIQIAIPVAEMVCLEMGQTVSATVGIHIDAAREQEIKTLVEYSEQATRLLIEQIKQIQGKRDA